MLASGSRTGFWPCCWAVTKRKKRRLPVAGSCEYNYLWHPSAVWLSNTVSSFRFSVFGFRSSICCSMLSQLSRVLGLRNRGHLPDGAALYIYFLFLLGICCHNDSQLKYHKHSLLRTYVRVYVCVCVCGAAAVAVVNQFPATWYSFLCQTRKVAAWLSVLVSIDDARL